MYVEDIARGGFKVYREHDPRVGPGVRNVKRGLQVKSQNLDGTYELENVGDEAGWLYWGAKASRQPGENRNNQVNANAVPVNAPGQVPRGQGGGGIVQAFPGDPGTITAGIISGPGANQFQGPTINVAFPGDPGTIFVGTGQAPRLGIVLTERAFVNKNRLGQGGRPKDVSRKIVPAEFQKPPAEQKIQQQQQQGANKVPSHKRELGSYAQIVPSVGTPEGLMPVGSKTGTVNQDYQPKKLSFGPYIQQQQEVRNINGYNSPHGMPGNLVQGISQTEHEQMFVPAGNILSCDHQSQIGGLSTRVFGVRQDNYIDASENQAAGLDSAWRIVLDKFNRKIIAQNFTKSGLDDTGFGAIVARTVNRAGNSVVTTSELQPLIVAYMSGEKNGPIVPGAVNDKHTLGKNKDGQTINPAHISAEAYVYRDRDRDGAIDFTNEDYPNELLLLEEKKKPDQKVTAVPVKAGFDKKNGKWRFWAENPEGKLFARIRWDYAGSNGDFSEAEIIDIDFDKDTFTPTSRLVWIDYERSAATQFATAGDGAIFLLSVIEQNFDRGGSVRDLCRAVSCFEDNGSRITHIEMSDAFARVGNLLTDAVDEKPWRNLFSSRIKTTIGSSKKENRIRVNIPTQWAVGGTADYKFLEISDMSRGLDFFAAPIRPVAADSTFAPGVSKLFESAETFPGGASIAQYLLAAEEE